MNFSSQKLSALRRWYGTAEFNLWVVAGIVLLGVVLGLLNNLRVYEEQRVEVFGPVPSTIDTGETEAGDAEGAKAPEQGEP